MELRECKAKCEVDDRCFAVDYDVKSTCFLHLVPDATFAVYATAADEDATAAVDAAAAAADYDATAVDSMPLTSNTLVDHHRISRICVASPQTTPGSTRKETYQDIFKQSENLMNHLNSSHNLAPNVSDVINILSSIDDVIKAMELNLDNSTRENIIEKTSILVEYCGQILSHNLTWNQMSREEKSQVTGMIFHNVDNSARLLSKCHDQFVLNTTNILIEIISSLSSSSNDDLIQSTISDNSKQNLKISRKNFQSNNSKLVVVSYSNVADLFSAETDGLINDAADLNLDQCGIIRSPANSVLDINSNVMSATIVGEVGGPMDSTALVDPINITFQHTRVTMGGQPICVFWNYSSDTGEGRWSSDGCKVTSSLKDETICSCDHLTNFAILMSFTDHVLTEEMEYGLSVITYVGCVVSLFCLTLAFATFTVFRNLRCDRNSIHKNLVFDLFVSEFIFFLGVDQICRPILCTIVAISLHYFFLCSFMWMCMEGFQLYILLVHVFNAEKKRMKIYYPIAYGIPGVIVMICLTIGIEGYGTKNYCWLNKENGFIWAFVGPVILILIINFHMLAITMLTMCHLSANTPIKQKESEKKMKKILMWIKSALVLMVLLGSTWLVGLFYLGQTTIAMAYIFTILNSLQGCFIFIFHCLLSKKVRNEYRRCWYRFSSTWLDGVDFTKDSKSTRRGTETTLQTYRPPSSTK